MLFVGVWYVSASIRCSDQPFHRLSGLHLFSRLFVNLRIANQSESANAYKLVELIPRWELLDCGQGLIALLEIPSVSRTSQV
jgi:hypothetical protein